MSVDQPAPGRRVFPFARLPSVPADWGRPLVGLWSLLLVATVIFSGIDIWQQWHLNNAVERPLTQVGLYEVEGDRLGPLVQVNAADAVRAGIRSPARIVNINGTALPRNADIHAIAAALDGPPGTLNITFATRTGTPQQVTLKRGPDVLATHANGSLYGWQMAVLIIIRTLPILALLVCSALLILRRRHEAVPVLLSFGFLSYALSTGGMLGLDWANIPLVEDMAAFVALALLAIALPAFPDGRYRSSFGACYGLLTCAILLLAAVSGDAESAFGLGMIAVLGAGTFLLARYGGTPPGFERQQLKWAGAGLLTCLIVALAAATTLVILETTLSSAQATLADTAAEAIVMLCWAVVPIGVTIALLQLRLWDADRAIMRSATIATLTAALGALWTVLSNLSNELLGTMVGPDNKAVIAGGSAMVAAAIINPLRGKVNGWVDKRFQGGLLALKAIPDQLREWQLSDTPSEAGERVLGVLVGKLKASAAALAVHENGAYRLVALHPAERGPDDAAVGEPEVVAWLEQFSEPGHTIDPVCFNDPLFAYRVPLTDRKHPVGLLMVARRPGGVGFASDEIKALRGIATPLAAALRLALRREQRDRRLELALKAMS